MQEPGPDIAVVLHDLRGGGAERAMLRLVEGFLGAGRTVDLVLFRKEGAYLADAPARARMVDLAAPRVMAGVGALRGYIARSRPATVLSALSHTNIATIAAARLAGGRRRIVVSERNQISEKAAAAASTVQRLTYRALPTAYRLADRIVAVSEGVARDLSRFAGLPADKIKVAYNPVVDATLHARAAAPAPHPWLSDGGPPVVLAVGRLAPQKDFATLLRAVAQVRTSRPVRLLILGEGESRAELEALGASLEFTGESLALPGFAPNPLAAMARANAVVLSSRFEGFPNVLVEALACGAPVAATDCPSGPREILADGAYGPLAPVGDEARLADAIAALLADPPPRARQIARGEVFSVDKAAQRYLEIIDEIPRR